LPRATSSTNVIATIGIDIGKNTFYVIGLDDKHAIILRRPSLCAAARQYFTVPDRHGGMRRRACRAEEFGGHILRMALSKQRT
jgi:hypothetical protein